MTDMRPEDDATGGAPHDAGGQPGERPADAEPPPQGTTPSGTDLDQLKDLLLFLPRLAVLVGKLIADPQVSGTDKLLLGAVVIYIASPLDILPDFIPVLGQLDDIYLVALALLRLLNRSGEGKLRQHWDGPEDIVKLLQTVTDYATRYLPQPVRTAVRNWVDVRGGGPVAGA